MHPVVKAAGEIGPAIWRQDQAERQTQAAIEAFDAALDEVCKELPDALIGLVKEWGSSEHELNGGTWRGNEPHVPNRCAHSLIKAVNMHLAVNRIMERDKDFKEAYLKLVQRAIIGSDPATQDR